MTYRINEFSFALPDEQVHDSSINILKFPALGTSLIVSRSMLADGETLHDSIEAQLKRLAPQVQDLRHEPLQPLPVGVNKEIDAIEFRSQFSKAKERVYQCQLALLMPGTRRMLALTYAKGQPLTAADLAHWSTLKQSLDFAAGA